MNHKRGLLILICIASGIGFAQEVIYQANFDNLAIGPIQTWPGAVNQDRWYLEDRGTDAEGEIQSLIAQSGNALRQLASSYASDGSHTSDAREMSPVLDISDKSWMVLAFDFYANSSDYDGDHLYAASIAASGGPHPGYTIIKAHLQSGNGQLKSVRQVDLSLEAFNGVDNNYGFEPEGGRGLAWDQWHHVEVVINHQTGYYHSVTVNGVTNDISGNMLPRSELGGVWQRGQQIEKIMTRITANGASSDTVCWDNISLKTMTILNTIYAGDFDSLATGSVQPHPGDKMQDYWFQHSRYPEGNSNVLGEIQNNITKFGNALHEQLPAGVISDAHTADKREIHPAMDISLPVNITLDFDFYAASSDYSTSDPYSAYLQVFESQHPGYDIIYLGLSSGNGTLKSQRNVDVDLIAFNGSDNNYVFTPNNGRTLAWDQWHHITLVIDQRNERYVSIAVDGYSEDISAHLLPRNPLENIWNRGQAIDGITAGLRNYADPAASTDHIYWDNISLTMRCNLQADVNNDCKVNLEDFAILSNEWLCGL